MRLVVDSFPLQLDQDRVGLMRPLVWRLLENDVLQPEKCEYSRSRLGSAMVRWFGGDDAE